MIPIYIADTNCNRKKALDFDFPYDPEAPTPLSAIEKPHLAYSRYQSPTTPTSYF